MSAESTSQEFNDIRIVSGVSPVECRKESQLKIDWQSMTACIHICIAEKKRRRNNNNNEAIPIDRSTMCSDERIRPHGLPTNEYTYNE